ncbi:12324_t:CDS:2 [Ambispora leptoticha]|uniref:12324_t:CDS:1 n=1 Tax=Ambispora leptoticha TaxID=144679 RepID=A0A9N9F232_9GLOM|nr:12324_t:CDS:2 [Ambispora leptoticha]
MTRLSKRRQQLRANAVHARTTRQESLTSLIWNQVRIDDELNNDEHGCSISDLLLVESKKGLKSKPILSVTEETQDEQNDEKGKPNEKQQQAGNIIDEEYAEYEHENIICKTIDFVVMVIQKEPLSNAYKVRYTAILYFLRLVLNGTRK